MPDVMIPSRTAAPGDVLEVLARSGLALNEDSRQRIQEVLTQRFSYQPKIGVFGKTGAGKSSLCNALFGQDVCAVSDVEACTRNPQEVLLSIAGQGLALVDVPGVGETVERDAEYIDLYRSLLPELDAVFWILKGDDRAYATDQDVFHHWVKPYMDAGKPFFILLNQVDKIEPWRDWQVEARQPGLLQAETIARKQEVVARLFELPLSKVIPVSASERYNLITVIDELIYALPADQKVIVLRQTPKENASAASRAEAEKGFWQVVDETIGAHLSPEGQRAYRAIKEGVRRFWDWLSA